MLRNNEEDKRPPLGEPLKLEHQRFIDLMMEVINLS